MATRTYRGKEFELLYLMIDWQRDREIAEAIERANTPVPFIAAPKAPQAVRKTTHPGRFLLLMGLLVTAAWAFITVIEA